MNILVSKDDRRVVAKLTDFGLSKSKISKSSKSNAGTTAYQPPEYGQEKLNGSVDIFAFGGVLVYLFGDEHVHPFDDLDDGAITRRMLHCYAQNIPLDVPELETIEVPEIRKIASQCLSTRSASRPTAHDLLEHFSDLCGLTGSAVMSNAAEDAMVKVQMRTLNILMEEVASLKAKMAEKDMEVNDLDVQMDFLMGKYTDSL